jgi:hypothetical protein
MINIDKSKQGIPGAIEKRSPQDGNLNKLKLKAC